MGMFPISERLTRRRLLSKFPGAESSRTLRGSTCVCSHKQLVVQYRTYQDSVLVCGFEIIVPFNSAIVLAIRAIQLNPTSVSRLSVAVSIVVAGPTHLVGVATVVSQRAVTITHHANARANHLTRHPLSCGYNINSS